jgi:hypothetical protein
LRVVVVLNVDGEIRKAVRAKERAVAAVAISAVVAVNLRVEMKSDKEVKSSCMYQLIVEKSV